MSAALSPVPDEPQGSGLPGEQDGDGWGETEGAQQGLYVTLPAEELSLEGFAGDGRADTMAPGRCWPWSWARWPGRTGKGWRGCPMIS